MTKCTICSNKIEELFLGKIKGTIIKKENSSKQYHICPACQTQHKNKEELLSKI